MATNYIGSVVDFQSKDSCCDTCQKILMIFCVQQMFDIYIHQNDGSCFQVTGLQTKDTTADLKHKI